MAAHAWWNGSTTELFRMLRRQSTLMQSSTTAPTPRRLGALALGAILVTLLTTLTLAGCGPTTPDSSLPTLTLGLTYVPNVQFAPFYVAEELGYYKTAGLNVILRHHNVGEDEFAAFA